MGFPTLACSVKFLTPNVTNDLLQFPGLHAATCLLHLSKEVGGIPQGYVPTKLYQYCGIPGSANAPVSVEHKHLSRVCHTGDGGGVREDEEMIKVDDEWQKIFEFIKPILN